MAIEAASDDVPPGHKRTQVGIIPEDWSTVTLFCAAGESKQRFDDGDWVEADFLSNSGVRLLQTGNIGVGTFIEKDAKKYISSSSFKKLRCKDVLPGDLLICRLADPAGRACIAPDLDEEKMITSVDVTIFRPLPEEADPRFLLGVFCTPRWFSEVADRCGGSTRSRISRSQLAKIQVQLPPIKEQRAIATALSDAIVLTESLDRLIAKKRAIKQAAMQQLLTGQTRLPGFTGKWETKRLGEVVGIRNQKVSPWKVEPHLACVELEHIGQRDGRLLGASVARNSASTKFRFFEGDVLFGRLRAYLRKFWHADRDGICTTEIWPLVAENSSIVSRFLLGIVQSEPFIEAASVAYGTHMPRADWKIMKNYEIQLPGIEEQTAIATILSDMDAEIEALEHRREKARQIKQGMMQQLLTGRVRLVEQKAA